MDPVHISSVNRKSFLRDQEFDVNSLVINDVLENIEAAGVIQDQEVLSLLKGMWITNLRDIGFKRQAARDDRGDSTSPDEDEEGEVVIAAQSLASSESSESSASSSREIRPSGQTGARPKVRQSGYPLRLDGAAECSTSDDDRDVIVVEKSKPKNKLLKKRKASKIGPQVDGPCDSSDSDAEDPDNEDENEDDDDDDDDDEDALGSNEEEEGAEEEPLGSGDDISEEDPSDLFNTENVVVCQYEKITRARNKWKFHLKDGIMNLNGRDYVFQRANGEAEW